MDKLVGKSRREYMSKMEQVIQIGEITGDIYYYIEDYAYTFFKKQEENNRKKYFLYGEKIETKDKTKLYIYGISQKPKMEQTYFKEYYPLGFLKVKGEDKYWVSLNGKENLITGIYIFYAPNQAMQEYLVDYHKDTKTEDKKEENTPKRVPMEVLPMKETMVSTRKWKGERKKKEEKTFYTIGGMVAAVLLLMILTSANGKNKLNLFKQVIRETMSNSVGLAEEQFIIEEKLVKQTEPKEFEMENKQEDNYETIDTTEENNENKIIKDITDKEEQNAGTQGTGVNNIIDNDSINYEISQVVEENNNDRKETEEADENNSSKEENIRETNQKEEYEEYIVKNGDTLVGICKKRYNSLSKMQQICQINNIKNADYIAPGQKLYLPR